MAVLSKIVSALALIASGALAVPNVTVVPATGGCLAYPDYGASTSTAGPWIVTVSGSDSPVEGYGDVCRIIGRDDGTGISAGGVMLPCTEFKTLQVNSKLTHEQITIVDDNLLAKAALRCNDATSNLEAFVSSGETGYAWQELNISEIPYDTELLWGVSDFQSKPTITTSMVCFRTACSLAQRM